MDVADAKHGPKLHAYLRAWWESQGMNQNQFAELAGMTAGVLTRWKQGVEPELRAYRLAARITGRPILEVLVGAGVLTSKEAGGVKVAVAAAPSLDAALARDTSVPVHIRKALAELLAGYRHLEAGDTESVTNRPAKRRGKKT